MDKIHTDEPTKAKIDVNQLKPSEEVTFKMGDVDLIGLSQAAIDAINLQPVGSDVKIICIAPNKFEVWA